MFGKKNKGSVHLVEDMQAAWTGLQKTAAKDAKLTAKPVLSETIAETIRTHFFELVNPSIAASLPRDQLVVKINKAVMEIVDREKMPLNWREQNSIAIDLLNDMLGVGPIEVLLDDETITDILVNGYSSIFVERAGCLELTGLAFRDDDHLLSVARRMAMSVGRRVDENSPMVDARLADGSRVNIIIPPLSVNGPIISIRKFPTSLVTLETLVAKNALSDQMADFLEIAARARLNILISGGTGAGKTTMLNALSSHIDPNERVVTIEDAIEINLQRPHVISLETRQRNIEGGGEVSQRDLLRNALRMRPDRIIIGEVRGAEAHEMLQAMNTGHDGSMSTIHANSSRDALIRLEDLLLSCQSNAHPPVIRRQIVGSLDLVIHILRDFRGHRYVRSISEVIGIEGDVIVMQDLFTFDEETGRDETALAGYFTAQPVRPHCLPKVRRYGLEARLQQVMNA